MTRSYSRSRRITQPLRVVHRVRERHPAITSATFKCFRLIPTGNGSTAMEVHHSPNRMAAFVTA
jgi:hypothetical protein